MKKCPECHKENPDEAFYCRFCYARVVGYNFIECPACHKFTPPNSTKCEYCGSKVEPVEDVFDINPASDEIQSKDKISEADLAVLLEEIRASISNRQKYSVESRNQSAYSPHEILNIGPNKQYSYEFSEDDLQPFLEKYNASYPGFQRLPYEFLHRITNNPHEVENCVDPMKYLESFDALHIQPGYVIDYFYAYEGTSSRYPLLYTRKDNDAPIVKWVDFFAKYPSLEKERHIGSTAEGKNIYLSNLQFDKSFMGVLQFGVFALTANHFYHFGSAGQGSYGIYLSSEKLAFVVLSMKMGGNIFMKYSPDDISKVSAVNPNPRVEINGNGANLYVFGSTRYTAAAWLKISINWPNKFNEISIDKVIAQGTSQDVWLA